MRVSESSMWLNRREIWLLVFVGRALEPAGGFRPGLVGREESRLKVGCRLDSPPHLSYFTFQLIPTNTSS